MSERKVLNKYFPPNFDPSLIKRRKMPKDKQQVVRLMAPFSMRCSTCGEYIYKGKKFNARKETVIGEEYYGIKIFRFYIKCTQCSAEITFKTDPKNTDYVAEHGAQRNFEPWRDTADEKQDIDKLDLLEQEENDPMADLESKAVDSKREMDILDALQELRSRNARIERAGKQDLNADRILDRVSSNAESVSRELETKLTEAELRRRKEEAEDEEEVRRVFGRAFVEGVPDIELDETGSSSTTDEDSSSEPGTPRDGSEVSSASEGSSAPIAGGSGLRTGASAGAGPIEASIKRKLDAVEPSPASLLSDASKSFVQKSVGSGGMPPPKKKKINAALAAKLGIKVTAKK